MSSFPGLQKKPTGTAFSLELIRNDSSAAPEESNQRSRSDSDFVISARSLTRYSSGAVVSGKCVLDAFPAISDHWYAVDTYTPINNRMDFLVQLPKLSSLHVRIDQGVATVTLDHPPVNTLDGPMMLDLHDLLGHLREDDSVRVIVFESAHEEFFLAHVDFGIFDSYPDLERVQKDYPHVNVHQGIGELLRSQPQITIVKLAGIARAGGAEFVAAADMTFAGTERGKIAQSEVLLGILPGGGGTQYLLEKAGRNRALEAVLGADLLDAETAALYGWINRAIPDAELDAFVERIAGNIAALDLGVIEGVKRALPAADLTPGLNVEHDAWNTLVSGEAPAKKMKLAMDRNLQSAEPERDLEGFLRQVASDI